MLVARGRKTERSPFDVHLKVREDARPLLVYLEEAGEREEACSVSVSKCWMT